MGTSVNADDLIVPFLPEPHRDPVKYCSDPHLHLNCRHNHNCSSRPSSYLRDPSFHKIQSFQKTVRVLQLDHSQTLPSVLSWIIGFVFVVVVPILRLWFLRASSDDTTHQLVFQSLVVIVGVAQSLVSFVFLSHAIRRHGIRGVLFLDAVEEEVTEVQDQYENIIQQGRSLLTKLFIPVFIAFIVFRVWYFSVVTLEPLPYEDSMSTMSLTLIIVLTSLSWIFQTTTYIYTCILFATVCALQELKMIRFRDTISNGYDAEYYYHSYGKIMKGLQATSRRFRLFLALIMTITIVGFLASMYKFVAADKAGIDMLMSGEIVVLNLVSLVGVGLCLRSSSKLSHLHRRIIKAAASMHAKETFIATNNTYTCINADSKTEDWLSKFCQVQNAWSRRAALVSYLSSSSVGISIYGFVIDRFFVHTSVGALLTTTWFILGRAL